jgi:hypothetical protein
MTESGGKRLFDQTAGMSPVRQEPTLEAFRITDAQVGFVHNSLSAAKRERNPIDWRVS